MRERERESSYSSTIENRSSEGQIGELWEEIAQNGDLLFRAVTPTRANEVTRSPDLSAQESWALQLPMHEFTTSLAAFLRWLFYGV
jgi:hypothetical protein